MEYTNKIEIALPRDQVVAKFDNEENMKHWQKGFVGMEHLSGEKGKTGATAKLSYKMGKREIEMIETITLLDLPEAFHLTFDAKNVYNIQENHFEELPNGHTRWISKNEFRFSGFMKIMGFLMPGAFRKQSLTYMQDFKTFAEEGKSVLEDS
ncbi:SRPBCC family protein [Aquimarina sp. 2201CG14-23]|uniref:SRPBCC family protein n=1 Tax=Aquimarina mycalae TaxID=3040073 RepID=UPI0024780F56|nr:SRPBCC family protein [Aquimarina sp. 2201CG14-23]MDH7444335.1 SRPBCC family protein [Aquimarina sp. 2201CG14-23]